MNKPENWYLQEPFQADETFISGWRIVYGSNPVCTRCGLILDVGDFVRWVGKHDKKRLVCWRCGDGQVRKTGS